MTKPDEFILPAEWEPQSGIQLTWPHTRTDWNPYLSEITRTFIEMTRIIAQKEKVLIVSPFINEVKELLKKEIAPTLQAQLLYYNIDTNDTWARDHAPITLVSTPRTCGVFVGHKLLDFHFNGWGNKFPSEKDNQITKQLYFNGALHGALEDHDDFVLEGGSIESDGQGTIFTTTKCLLAPHRNQPLAQKEIEHRLKQMLHAQRIVWLDHGELIGDDTDSHIDTIVRLAPNNTILYVGCDDTNDPHYADFMALENQLKNLRTLDKQTYRLLKLPMPDAIFEETDNGKERLPATYANFVIINDAVIYPTYNQPDKDAIASELIRQAFPTRQIIGVDARIVIRQHGSLHCLTMQYPQGVLEGSANVVHYD